MASSIQKILSLKETQHLRQQLKQEQKQVVFTNGCFDILHPGHTRYLSSARDLGDFLMVAVNSDRSIAQIKGPKRPIVSQQIRAEVLAALACVDGVFIFDQADPLQVIQYLLPDILVKGGDWAEGDIIGADVVKENGGKVVRIPFVAGFSTTQLIQSILKRYG
ncbi:MAG: D-glycero-beta-D-manno-heptose 1-phosphate adenylyltransferase [Thermodesulfobacteriota bacterium]